MPEMQRITGTLWGHTEMCGLDFKMKSLLIFMFSPIMCGCLSRVQNMWTARFNKGGLHPVSTIEEFKHYLEGPKELLKVSAEKTWVSERYSRSVWCIHV